MTKKSYSAILWCALVLCMLLSMAFSAAAAPEAEYLTTIDDGEQLLLTVYYDKEFPSITLIDPNEKEISVTESSKNIQLAIHEQWALIQVNNPAAGDWQIAVDKKSNTEVSWELMSITENIWIQYINVAPADNGTVTVTYLAERGDDRISFDYELALTTANSSGSTVVKTGRAVTGEESTILLNMKAYTSYDQYVLRMTVTADVGDTTLFDEYESAPFAYVNPNTPDAPKGIDIRVDNENRELEFDWKNHKSSRFDSFYLEVFADGQDEPIYYGEFEYKDNYFSTFIPNDLDNLTVKFYGREGKLLSEPITRSVLLGDSSYLQILTQSPTASSQAQIKMNLPDQTELTVTVGENTFTFLSDGKENTVAVGLSNGTNLVTAKATVDGIEYRAERRIYKDGFGPQITFHEPYDGKTFHDNTITLIGNVEGAVNLFLNDEPFEINEYGDFEVSVTLEPGENIAEFVAEDAVGNRTALPITLYYPEAAAATQEGNTPNTTKFNVMQFLPLFIALGVSVVLLIVMLVLVKRREKLKKFSFAAIIVLLIAAMLLCGCNLVYNILHQKELEKTVNSMELSKLADKSLSEATALLEELDQMPEKIEMWIIITSILAGVCLLVIILVCVLKAIKKHPKQPKPPKESAPAPQPVVVDTPPAPAPAAEVPAEPEVPAVTEVPAEPEVPAVTEVPVEPEAPAVTEVPAKPEATNE